MLISVRVYFVFVGNSLFTFHLPQGFLGGGKLILASMGKYPSSTDPVIFESEDHVSYVDLLEVIGKK